MKNVNDFIKLPFEDIEIDVTNKLTNWIRPDGIDINSSWWWYFDGNRILIKIPELGQFILRNGNYIEVQLEDEIDYSDLQAFFASTLFSILIHYRRELPLHAAGLVSPRGKGATLICGKSGVGKSTTSALLYMLGWHVMADDLCRISMAKTSEISSNIILNQGYTKIMLMPDACDFIGTEKSERAFVSGLKEKYYYSTSEALFENASIERVIVLIRPADSKVIDIAKCTADAAVAALLPYVTHSVIQKALPNTNAHSYLNILSNCSYPLSR